MTSTEKEKALQSEASTGGSWGNPAKGQGLASHGTAACREQVRQRPEVRVKEPPSARISSQLPSPQAVVPGE